MSFDAGRFYLFRRLVLATYVTLFHIPTPVLILIPISVPFPFLFLLQLVVAVFVLLDCSVLVFIYYTKIDIYIYVSTLRYIVCMYVYFERLVRLYKWSGFCGAVLKIIYVVISSAELLRKLSSVL